MNISPEFSGQIFNSGMRYQNNFLFFLGAFIDVAKVTAAQPANAHSRPGRHT
jgi:hypothetical protein